ncbi:MAG TPA: molybdopterin-dependent oxidoreductase, partial [Acidobacteriota bacterium]|nr:molybdopterin-dependent oxidoreductase [Acidobacteriota bacterium]
VPAGTTVLQAAEQLGIFIPHYCYHPGLSIAGSCRMCLVEIEKAPKLQIACYTVVTEGMVVRTDTEKVTVARQAMLEFLLANHPLDCPVCDQAGECKLQQYYMDYGRYDSAVLEDKHKKHKALPIGPHIILDSERCILCSRCVRFVDEITRTHELGIFERGSHSELLPVHGTTVDNPYSGCLADICPVGALTDRDFRFKVRVWYLEQTPSVCHGCVRGCSIEIHTNRRRSHHNDGKLIARYKPRFNPEVNGHWICDAGRYSYKTIESDDRLRQPVIRESGGDPAPVAWETALARIDEVVTRCVAESGADSVAVVATPGLSNEELWAVRRLLVDGMKVRRLGYRLPPDPRGVEDDLLRRADTFPNSFGAHKILGPATSADTTVDSLLVAGGDPPIRVLFVIGGGLPGRFGDDLLRQKLSGIEFVVALQTHRSVVTDAATVVLPVATYAETDGSVCNFEGQIQRYWAAMPPVGDSRALLAAIADLAARWDVRSAPRDAGACFAELAGKIAWFAGLTHEALGDNGVNPSRRVAPAPSTA